MTEGQEQRSSPEQGRGEGRERRPGALRRVKLPLWLALGIVVGVIVLFLFLLAGQSEVELGPALRDAEIVRACVLLPEARPTFDITQAEKAFERGLLDLGARQAEVRVQRPPDQCPAPGATPVPTQTTSATTTTRRS